MNIPTTDTRGTLIYKEMMEREKKSLVNWEYKHGPLAGASMDAESKPGRLYVELQRGRNFAPLDTDGLADSYVQLRLNDQAVKRSSTVRSLDPVWNEQFQFDCTRTDTLTVEVFDDDSMKKVRISEYSELQGAAKIKMSSLKPSQHETRTLQLSGGPGRPTLMLSIMWQAKAAITFASQETALRASLAQMRTELAVARAKKASWENSSGYLRSFGVLAPAEARTGTLEGPAVCEVFPDAKWPEGQPRKYGLLKPEEMRPSRATLEAIAKAHGSSEFQVIKQSENTGGVDVVVGPGRNAQAYQDFQNRWKAVDMEVQDRAKQNAFRYPSAPDGTTLPCLYGGFKRRAGRFF